jgi:uncharacterized membrane protein YccC
VLREIPGALAAEMRALEWRGRRGQEAFEAAASVTLALVAALALHSDEPWWAAITAFMVTRAVPRIAVERGILRIAGSIVGAGVALVVLRLFVYQSLPFLFALFLLSCIGLFGFVCSRHAYAWLIGAVTAALVMLMTFDQPQQAFAVAVDRVADVVVGTAASLVVCLLMPAPAASDTAPPLVAPPPMAFWRRDYGEALRRWLAPNAPLVLHACCGGLTVMLMPALAEWIAPITPVAMGVTAVIVLGIPTTAIFQHDNRAIIERATHRLVGCLLGALAGLACLAFVGGDFLLWLALIASGIWLCSQIQTGGAGVSYVGTQAMFAYLTTIVQGQGPAQTIAPGFERLVGVIGGLAVLYVITLALSLIPLPQRAAGAAAG